MVIVKNNQQLKQTLDKNGILKYDQFGNRIKEIWDCDYIFQYEYDKFGNKIKTISYNLNVTTWEYDHFGNGI